MTLLLRAAGHEVAIPTLTGLGERAHLHYADIDMNTHIQDVVGVLECEDLTDVILVGHSLSGSMIPAVAERVPERVAHIVNLDGPLAEDGKACKDLLADFWDDFRRRAAGDDPWWVPPPDWTFGVTGADLIWTRSKLTPHPLRTWETPLVFASPVARAIPRTFICCTEGVPPEEIARQERQCAEMGWQMRTLPTDHDAMITLPQGLVELLLDLI